MNRVLIALDKFKDAMGAAAACRVVAEAWREHLPDWVIDVCPWSDGGDGFAEVLTGACGGRWVAAEVHGPRTGMTVRAGLGLVPGTSVPEQVFDRDICPGLQGRKLVGVVEMPLASGLALLDQELRNPWQTTTLGTGELMAAALREGADAILLGIGGSATNDVGLGALAALGMQAVDVDGQPVSPPIPAVWSSITGFHGHLSQNFPPIFIACDVSNPLLGPRGCTTVYGPQKGLLPEDTASMEHAVAHMAGLLCRHCGRDEVLALTPGAGAAGGIAFGLLCAAGARLVPGSTLVAAWLGLEEKLRAADVVVTGEGSFDATSLEGKGSGTLARKATELGKQVIILAGCIEDNLKLPAGMSARAVTPPGTPLAEALAATRDNLRLAAAAAAADICDAP